MPNWKKVITSGSNAHLNQITSSGFNLVGTGTAELEVDGHITASGNISSSGLVKGLNVKGTNSLQTGTSGVGLTLLQDTNNASNLTFLADTHGMKLNHLTASGNISASITSTGSFGTLHLEGTNFSSASLAAAIAGGGGSGDITGVDLTGGTNISIASETGTTSGDYSATINLDTSPSITHLTASGNISASSNIKALTYQIQNQTLASRHSVQGISFGNLNDKTIISGDTLKVTPNITASGNISASGGDIITTNFRVPGTDASSGYFIDALSSTKPTLNNNNDRLIIGAAHSTYIGKGVTIFSSGSGEGLKMDALGNITASGNISGSASTRIDAQDLFLTRNLNTPMIESTDDLTIDVGGDLTLDAAGDDIFFKDNGTTRFTFNLDGAPSIDVVGSFEIDSSGDITLDAAGDDIFFKDAGSTRFTFNLDSTPEIDVTGDFTLDGSGDIKLDSATNVVDLVGNVTSSGNISASGQIHRLGGKLEVTDRIMTNNLFEFSENHGIIINDHITASGDISASGDITSNTLNVNTSGELTGSYGTLHGAFNINYGNATTFSSSLASAGDGYGEIMSHLGINGPSKGDLVYHSGGDWRPADADNENTANSMLGVALADSGGTSVPGPVLIRGIVRLGAGHITDSSGTNGDPLYLSGTSGHVQFAVPGSGDFARIVGYCIDEDNDIIYFNPGTTFVEVS